MNSETAFKTNLFRDDYLGNAIGQRIPELEFMGEVLVDPEMLRPNRHYNSERLANLRDVGGKQFSSKLEDNFEPELLEYMNNLVDRIKQILDPARNLSQEEKLTELTALYEEAKGMKNLNQIQEWKQGKEKEMEPGREFRRAA